MNETPIVGDGPAASPPRSTFVTVVAWLFIVLSGCATPISVLQNIMVLTIFKQHPIPSDNSALDHMPAATRFMFTHMDLFFQAFLVLCIYTLVCSIGLLKRRNWARLGFVALLVVGILYQVAGFAFQSFFMAEFPDRQAPEEFRTFVLLMQIFGAGMAIALVLVFGWMIRKLISPSIRAEFGA